MTTSNELPSSNSGCQRRPLVILANGPSLNDAGLERLKGLPIATLAINTPLPSLWPTTYWLVVDNDVLYVRHPDLLQQYEGTLITPCRVDKQHVIDFKVKRGFGFSREPFDGFYTGRSSSYVALQFTIGLGYSPYFFGLDMRPDDGYCFYGPNPDRFSRPHQRAARFEQEAKFWDDAVANHLTEEERGRVTLCGLADWPFTKHFRRLSPREGVEELLNDCTIIV